jgi:ACS family D-galactonate transporter-like MFS transporter
MGGPNLAVVFATMNMAGNLGSWAFTQFFPRIVKWGGWDGGLLVFAAMHVVAIGAWLIINPNGIIGERAEEPNSKE